MRPLLLSLTAFGPFAGREEVSFDALAPLGLFTVTGPTGSGKTTVFDALTYALFGQLPGDRAAGEARSHHASATDPTTVTLEFEVAGQRWRVARSPEQEVMGRRKMRVQKAEARLDRWEVDRWQGFLNGPRQVDAYVVELVGLTAYQFERVVLLPQGRFQRLLLAGTRERRELLRHLFGTELYERAAEAMLERAKQLGEACDTTEQLIRHHLANVTTALAALAAGEAEAEEARGGPRTEDDPAIADIDVDGLAAQLGEHAATLDRLEAALHAQRAEEAAALVAAQRAEDTAARWDRRQALLTRRAAHEALTDTIASDGTRAAAARQATPVVRAATLATKASDAAAAARAARIDACAALDEALTAVELPTDGSVDATVLAAQAERVRAAQRTMAERQALATELGDVQTRLNGATERLDDLARQRTALATRRSSLDGTLATIGALADRLVERQAIATAAEAAVEQRARLATAESASKRAMHRADEAATRLADVTRRFVEGFAPRLAAELHDGEPCPVCGSADHPAPAHITAGEQVTVTLADVEAAQAAAHDTATLVARRLGELHTLTEQLGEVVGIEPDELQRRAEEASAARDEAKHAAARRPELAAERDALDIQMAAVDQDIAARQLERARFGERAGNLGEQIDRLDAQLRPWLDVDLAARVASLTAASTALAAVAGREQQAAVAAHQAAAAQAGLAEVMRVSSFATVDDAEAAALASEQIVQLEQRVQRWHDDEREITAGLAALADDDLPDDRPDPSELRVAATRLTAAVRAAHTVLVQLQQHATQAAQHLTAISNLLSEAAAARHAAVLAEEVARTCAGQGPGRIALESWVLAAELDRVTDAANVHLARMSSGRYQLTRTDGVSHAGRQAGLDLAVFDSHTGRHRPTITLSGGEQFQASLSLALGLADVVSHAGSTSGKVFEALFVDEGFGSLDPAALDLAIAALDELRGGGRTVGVITHVEAMKTALPLGIEVRPLRDAPGSSLIVRTRAA